MKHLLNYSLILFVVISSFGCGKPWYKKNKVEISPGVNYNPEYLTKKVDDGLVPKMDSNTLLYHILKNEEKYGIREKLNSVVVSRAKKLNPSYRVTSEILAREGLDEGRNQELTKKFRETLISRVEKKYSENKLKQLVNGEFYINFKISLNQFKLSNTQDSYVIPARNSITIALDRRNVQIPIIISNLNHPQIRIPFNSESSQRNLLLTLKQGKFKHPTQGANIGSIKNCNIDPRLETISCEANISESEIIFVPDNIARFYRENN